MIRPYRHHQGFTLLEMLTVMCLSALLALATVPAMGHLLQDRVFRIAARQLGDDLRLLRTLSLAQGESVSISLWPQQRCYVLHTGPSQHCHCDPQAAWPLDASTPAPAGVVSVSHLEQPGGSGLAQCSQQATPLLARQWPANWQVSSASVSQHFDPLNHTLTPTATWRLNHPAGLSAEHIVNVLGRVRSCSRPRATGGMPSCP